MFNERGKSLCSMVIYKMYEDSDRLQAVQLFDMRQKINLKRYMDIHIG